MDISDINDINEKKPTSDVPPTDVPPPDATGPEMDNKYDAYLKESKSSDFEYSKGKAPEKVEEEQSIETGAEQDEDLSHELDDKYQDYIASSKEFSYGESSKGGKLPEPFENLPEADKQKEMDALSKMSDKERAKYLEIASKEPAITKDATEIAASSGGELQGLEYRLKTPSSTYEKMHDRDDSVDIEEMGDVIRYTEVHPPDKLAEGANNSLAEYESRGYTVDRVKNTWDDEDSCYKGINATLTSPEGQTFEAQYHTQESYDLKNEMHPQYEEWRTLADNDPRKKEIGDQMKQQSSELHRPENVEKVKNR